MRVPPPREEAPRDPEGDQRRVARSNVSSAFSAYSSVHVARNDTAANTPYSARRTTPAPPPTEPTWTYGEANAAPGVARKNVFVTAATRHKSAHADAAATPSGTVEDAAFGESEGGVCGSFLRAPQRGRDRGERDARARERPVGGGVGGGDDVLVENHPASRAAFSDSTRTASRWVVASASVNTASGGGAFSTETDATADPDPDPDPEPDDADSASTRRVLSRVTARLCRRPAATLSASAVASARRRGRSTIASAPEPEPATFVSSSAASSARLAAASASSNSRVASAIFSSAAYDAHVAANRTSQRGSPARIPGASRVPLLNPAFARIFSASSSTSSSSSPRHARSRSARKCAGDPRLLTCAS